MRRILSSNLNFLLIIAIILSLLLPLAQLSRVHAVPGDGWVDPSATPTISAGWDGIDLATYNDSVTWDNTEPCKDKTAITRPKNGSYSQLITTKCWYQTPIGLVSGQTLVPMGSNIAGEVTNRSGYMKPSPHAGLTQYTYGGGTNTLSKLRFLEGITLSNTTVSSTGVRTYTVDAAVTHTIVNAGGVEMGLLSSSGLNYSDDGKYILGASQHNGFFRYNLETKQILTFGPTNLKGAGYTPNYKFSISPSGRYVVAVNTHPATPTTLKIYDLGNCINSEAALVASLNNNCAFKDLSSQISNQILSFNRIRPAEFVDEEHIIFYHYTSGSTPVHTQYVLSAPGASGNTDIRYMALGDSIASGEGAHSYESGTDVSINKCHLSTRSYPYRISSYMGLAVDKFHSAACSGATINNVVGGGGISMDSRDLYRENQYDPERMSELEPGVNTDWIPGFESQIKKVQRMRPSVMTVSMAANNMGFKEMLQKCLTSGSDCYTTYAERQAVAKSINGTYYRLVQGFKSLKKQAAYEAKMYVIGYPSLMATGGTCAANVLLSPAERDFANLVTQRLNLVIRQAAEYAGVRYVDVENALEGHRLCEDSPLAVNGLTYGQESYNLFGAESYHPNALGHELLRDAVMVQTAAFTQTNPAPDISKTIPVINDSIPLLASVTPGAAYSYNPLPHQGLVQDVLIRSGTYELSIQGHNFDLSTSKTYTIELNSTPLLLGTAQPSAANGNIDLDITVPSTVEPGFHTLRVYGQDLNNQQIDIYKTIFIAASETDYNGDGNDDLPGECVLVPNSEVDDDDDGIDDACDPYIGDEDPEVSEPEEPEVLSMAPRMLYKHEEEIVT